MTTLKARTLTPFIKKQVPVVLHDYELVINLGTAASCEPSPGNRVEGLLYTLSPRSFLALSVTEGVPIAYTLKVVNVVPLGNEEGGTPIDALTFTTGRGLTSNKTSPSYKELLLKGAIENELSEDYIENVLAKLAT